MSGACATPRNQLESDTIFQHFRKCYTLLILKVQNTHLHFHFLSKTHNSKCSYLKTKIVNNDRIWHQERTAQEREGTDARRWGRESKTLSHLIPKDLPSYILSKCARWIFYAYLSKYFTLILKQYIYIYSKKLLKFENIFTLILKQYISKEMTTIGTIYN